MKIALVGSAPSSVRNAPYNDPSWRIYACSPGAYGHLTRCDEFFETHRWEPGQAWFSPEYIQWMTALAERGGSLWVGGPVPTIPKARRYPFDKILAAYDPQAWFCTSSLFWMMGRAIEAIKYQARAQGRAIEAARDKIAFYGVDMAADTEYEMQRAGIHFMAYKAAALGIEVGAPPESDLFTPRFKYGADEWTHSYVKMRARRAELEHRKREAEIMEAQATQAKNFLTGALDDLKYMHDTWADKQSHLGPPPATQPIPNSPQGTSP